MTYYIIYISYQINIFLEIAVPSILAGLDHRRNSEVMPGRNVFWHDVTEKKVATFLIKQNYYIHPFKVVHENQKTNYCEKIIQVK